MGDTISITKYVPFNDPTWVHKLVRAKDLTPGEKVLYACLVDFGGKNGECFPKQRTLAEELGITERAVRRQIKKLIDLKYIQIEHPSYGKRWKRRNSKYTFIDPSHRTRSSYTIGHRIPTVIGHGVPAYELRSNERRSEETVLLKKTKRTDTGLPRQPRLPTLEKHFDQEPEPSLPPSVRALVNYYYKIIPVTRPGPRTKAMKENVHYLKRLKAGKLYNKFYPKLKDRKFTDEEIEKAFESHAIAFDPDYEMPNKKYYELHIHDFLLNPYRTTKSYFLKWFETPPQRSKEKPAEDKHPEITSYLVKQLTNGKALEESELNKVKKASNRMAKWYKVNKNHLSTFLRADELGELLWRSVEDVCEYDQITAGFLCSDLTFRKRLPDYFDKQALFQQTNHERHVENHKDYVKYV